MTTNLRQRMTEDMQVRNLSPLTQSTTFCKFPCSPGISTDLQRSSGPKTSGITSFI